jgi:hypothetical protein
MPDKDNVISLADRVLGGCPACGQPVLFAENFIRAGRAFLHVACALRTDVPPPGGGEDFPRLVPPLDRGA